MNESESYYLDKVILANPIRRALAIVNDELSALATAIRTLNSTKSSCWSSYTLNPAIVKLRVLDIPGKSPSNFDIFNFEIRAYKGGAILERFVITECNDNFFMKGNDGEPILYYTQKSFRERLSEWLFTEKGQEFLNLFGYVVTTETYMNRFKHD